MEYIVPLGFILAIFGLVFFLTKVKIKDKKMYNEKIMPSKNWGKVLYHSGSVGAGLEGHSYLKLSDGKSFSLAKNAFSFIFQIKQTSEKNINGTYQRTYTSSTSTQFAELKLNDQIYHFMIDVNKTNMSVKIKGQEYCITLSSGGRLGNNILKDNTTVVQTNKVTDHYTEFIFSDHEVGSEELVVLSFLSMSDRLY